jgi:hypothetical protein
VKPVSLSVKAIINKGTPTEHLPQLTAEILVEEIDLHLTDTQYSDMIDLMENFQAMEKRKKVTSLQLPCLYNQIVREVSSST